MHRIIKAMRGRAIRPTLALVLAMAVAVLASLAVAAPASAAVTFEESTSHHEIRLSGEIPANLKQHVEMLVSSTTTCPTEIAGTYFNERSESFQETASGEQVYDSGHYGKGTIVGQLYSVYYETMTSKFGLRIPIFGSEPATGTHAVCLYTIPGTERCTEGGPLTRECNKYFALVENLGTFTFVNHSQLEYEEKKAKEEAEAAKLRQEAAERKAAQEASERQAKEAYERKQAQEQAEQAAQVAREHQECKAEYDRAWTYHNEEYRGEYTVNGTHCSAAEAKEFKAQEEAREQAQRAQEEREYNAAKARAQSKPLTHLAVNTVARNGRSSAHPGHTALSIKTNPFAIVTVKLNRRGHSKETYEFGYESQVQIEKAWSCQSPGGIYHYVITAHSGVGPTFTKKGAFRPVSLGRCHALERAEQEARERRARAFEEQLRHEREAEQARINLFKENCRKANGTPRLFNEEGGKYWRCVAPGGGFLSVP